MVGTNTSVATSHSSVEPEHYVQLFEAVTRHYGRTVGRISTVSVCHSSYPILVIVAQLVYVYFGSV